MPLRFEKVDFEYSPGTPFAFQALKNINLELAEGKMTAIIGATGSGKTTLVQHLNALLLPSKGTVNVLDFQINAGKKFTEVKKLRHQVGLVFQFAEYQLFEETILKDVCFGPLNFGVEEKEAETIARRCLKTVGIDPADFTDCEEIRVFSSTGDLRSNRIRSEEFVNELLDAGVNASYELLSLQHTESSHNSSDVYRTFAFPVETPTAPKGSATQYPSIVPVTNAEGISVGASSTTFMSSIVSPFFASASFTRMLCDDWR